MFTKNCIILLLFLNILSGKPTSAFQEVASNNEIKVHHGDVSTKKFIVKSEIAAERKNNHISAIENEDQFCNFGFGDDVTLCSWHTPKTDDFSRNLLPTALTSWTLSNGMNALWVGGPLNDTTGDRRGGYAFHETSSVPGLKPRSAIMESNTLPPTGASGRCLKFWYSIEGLSANMLRVKVRSDDGEDAIIWETKDPTRGDWKEAQALYTFTANHTIVMEGVPANAKDPFNIFRGHVAVDDLGVRSGVECIGLCSFEGGLCNWANAENDDFNWKLGRGTQNPITGPPRDHSSSLGDYLGGAYIFIDSDFPRRPEDYARLESIDFQETDPNNPPCMQFFTFLSGRGVGSLRILLQDVETRRERVIWALAGNQGARWIRAQMPLSSSVPFRVIFEGSIGMPMNGDIAMDDISIMSGPCSTLPTAASPPSSGDCTFEEGSCGWVNPTQRHRLDDIDFVRVQAKDLFFPTEDHTTRSKEGFYMALENPEPKLEGDRAWLISPAMSGKGEIKCISFWYLMFEPLSDDVEPNLGSLSIFMKRDDGFGSIVLTPIWSMQNFQGLTWNFAQAPLRIEGDFEVVIEAVWGSSVSKGPIAIDDVSVFEGSCPTLPPSSLVRAGDCTFTRGACGWRNLTSDPEFYWTFADPTRKPNGVYDHTYGSQIGYSFFDVYNLNARSQRLQMLSPVMEPEPDRNPLCFTFWFNGYGTDPNTTLNVYQRSAHLDGNQITNLESEILIWSYQPLREHMSGWQFGQVSLVSGTRFQIVVEGSSHNGGFAVDDFKIYTGACKKRPRNTQQFLRPDII